MSFNDFKKEHHAFFNPVVWGFLALGAVVF
jgi:hypothetical protein